MPRRISWAETLVWAAAHDLREDEMDDLRHLLGEMEQEFEAVEAERRASRK